MRALPLVLASAAFLAGCEAQERAPRGKGGLERGLGQPPWLAEPLQPEPDPTPDPTPSPSPTPTPTPTPEPTSTPTPAPGPTPGPTPLADCALDLDDEGFFTRVRLDGTFYVGFLPPRYADAPLPLVVGLHGCGDDAWDFAEWAVNPEEARGEQAYIGISVEQSGGGGGCWSNGDIPRVLAAIEDVSRCVYVDRNRIFVGGYSSGGELAYVLGLRNADFFAGILVENTSLRRAGDPGDLISGASRLIPIAHVAHIDDGSYPIEGVREDWERLREAGFPLETAELDGGHDGTTEDWLWLFSRAAEWDGLDGGDGEEPPDAEPEPPEGESGGGATGAE